MSAQLTFSSLHASPRCCLTPPRAKAGTAHSRHALDRSVDRGRGCVLLAQKASGSKRYARTSLHVYAAKRPFEYEAQKRWQTRTAIKRSVQQLRHLLLTFPPIALIIRALQSSRQKLEPQFRIAARLWKLWCRERNKDRQRFEDFRHDEFKREFYFKYSYMQERDMWKGVFHYIYVLMWITAWWAITPPDFILCIVGPMLFAWWWYGRQVFKSPIFAGIVVMFDMKFPIGALLLGINPATMLYEDDPFGTIPTPLPSGPFSGWLS